MSSTNRSFSASKSAMTSGSQALPAEGDMLKNLGSVKGSPMRFLQPLIVPATEVICCRMLRVSGSAEAGLQEKDERQSLKIETEQEKKELTSPWIEERG